MYRSRGAGPKSPAMEPYYGRVKTNDFIVGNLPFIGQAAPLVRERMRSYHGRYLSGVEGFSGDGVAQNGGDPEYETQALDELESQDDVFGSGIFDQAGRGATANADTGVFASNYALPGFVAREIPFTVSRDIKDITDNADVVMVPGGGMTFAEVRGQVAPANRVAQLGPRQGMSPMTRPVMPQYANRPVQSSSGERPVAMPAQRVIGSKMIVQPQDMKLPVKRAMGAEEEQKGASAGQMVLWGLIIGAAVGGVVVLVKSHK